jgi:hypothetical protein
MVSDTDWNIFLLRSTYESVVYNNIYALLMNGFFWREYPIYWNRYG